MRDDTCVIEKLHDWYTPESLRVETRHAHVEQRVRTVPPVRREIGDQLCDEIGTRGGEVVALVGVGPHVE